MAIDRSTTAVELVRSNFFGKDFDSIRQEVIDTMVALSDPETTSNFVVSDLGIMLIEAMSYAMATQNWYGDRQAGETSLDLEDGARIRANAVAIARALGYKPNGAVPPVAELSLTISPAAPIQFTIPKGTKLVESSGLPFETAEDVTFGVGETGPKTFLARQGETQEELFTSDGSPNQRFFLETVREGFSIAEGTVEAVIDSVDWEPIPLLEPRQDNIYEVSLGTNPPFVRTGDNIFGNIPETGVEVRINYFTTAGPDGAVASETITGFVDPIFAGVTLITPTIDHPEPSTAGSFRESINSIKRNAPLVFQTGQRAVTIRDLDGLINSFVDATWGAVAKGRATTPRSAAADARLQSHISTLRNNNCLDAEEIDDLERYWNKVVSSECQANIVMAQILAADAEGRYVVASKGLAEALETYLDALVESTVKVWAIDGSVNLFSVDIEAQIKVVESRDTEVLRATIISNVEQLIRDFLLGRDFGVSAQISDLYSRVEAVDGVDYANVKAALVQNQGDDVTSEKTDEFGNVIVETFEVITMGSQPVVTIIEV